MPLPNQVVRLLIARSSENGSPPPPRSVCHSQLAPIVPPIPSPCRSSFPSPIPSCNDAVLSICVLPKVVCFLPIHPPNTLPICSVVDRIPCHASLPCAVVRLPPVPWSAASRCPQTYVSSSSLHVTQFKTPSALMTPVLNHRPLKNSMSPSITYAIYRPTSVFVTRALS